MRPTRLASFPSMISSGLTFLAMISSALAFLLLTPSAEAAEKTVKVFILAGQSNMEGKGFPEPLAYQVTQKAYRDRYLHLLKDGDAKSFTRTLEKSLEKDERRPVYEWGVRDDVWIDSLGKRSGLTVGYGVPDKCFGPELNFGHIVGDHCDEPVLIIKTAWGGKSLGQDFLPPSADQPTDELLKSLAADQTERAQKNAEKKGNEPPEPVTADQVKERYGHFYREMMRHVRENLDQLGDRFPELKRHKIEMSGFVWFQGWNDQFNPEWAANYESNLAALIRDVRRDLDTPDLPVVIGQVGFDGSNEPKDGKDGKPNARTLIQRGQMAVSGYKEFKGRVTTVETAPFWDWDADAIYRGEGGWKKDVEKWKQFGNDRPYHYYGSPWFFAQAGEGFGKAMVNLLDTKRR